MTLHVHAPAGFTYRIIRACPYCERRRRFVVQGFVWYGPEMTCGGCGHQWSDYERRRQTNKQRALNRHGFHERWMAAGTFAEYMRWMNQELAS